MDICGQQSSSGLTWDSCSGCALRAVQGLPLRQIYLNIVTDTLRLMNEHHLMHPPLLRAIALYVIVSLNNKVCDVDLVCHLKSLHSLGLAC